MSKQKPLIMHIIHRFDVGGLENGLVNLINRSANEPFRHMIVCLTRSSAFSGRLHDPVPIVELKKRDGRDWGIYFKLWKLLRQYKPALVHTRNYGPLNVMYVANWFLRLTWIHSEHGWDMEDLQGERYLPLRRRADRFIKHYIALTKDIQAWLMSRLAVSENRTELIMNGVDTERFSKKYSQEKHAVTVGYVGRLATVKNLSYLLEAFAEALQQNPSMRLLFVGSGPEADHLLAQAKALGVERHVTFKGKVEDTAACYQAMDIFVLPSHREGMSNTLLEAMSSGLAVLASNVGGNPEIIEDGVDGKLFPLSDVSSLAKVIAQYAKDEVARQRMGDRARQKMCRDFALNTMVNKYFQRYKLLVRK